MKILHQIFAILVITAAVSISTIKAAKYLANKPDYLNPCLLQDPNFKKCFMHNFQVLYREWKDGIPGFKAGGSFDPLYVKRIVITQDPQSQLALNADLSDVVVTGASKMIAQDINFDVNSLGIYAKLLAPKLRLDFDYKLNGRILNLPLKSRGKGFMEVENFNMALNIKVKLRDEHDFTFTDIEKVKLEIKDIGGFHVHFDNLFNGQKELEDSINTVFNENWREFYEILRPAIIQSVQEIMKDRLSKAFSYVPGNYFIADLPSAAQYVG